MTTPGWYDDGQGAVRYWDGQQWTEHTAPTGVTPPVPIPAAGATPHVPAPATRRRWLPVAIVLALLLVAGGGFAVWQVVGGPAEPEEVAEEYLDVVLRASVTGELDERRACDLSTGDAKSNLFYDEDERANDCNQFKSGTTRSLDSYADYDRDCRERADAVTWEIEAQSSPRGAKAVVEAEVKFQGFSEFARECWDEDESDNDTLVVDLVNDDDGWKVESVDW